jgi:hypothetical protein
MDIACVAFFMPDSQSAGGSGDFSSAYFPSGYIRYRSHILCSKCSLLPFLPCTTLYRMSSTPGISDNSLESSSASKSSILRITDDVKLRNRCREVVK